MDWKEFPVKIYTSEVKRAQDTADIVAKSLIENFSDKKDFKYKSRVRKYLFSKHEYFPPEIMKRRKEERINNIPEPLFVTEFLRGKWSYYDEQKKEVLCHPINLATPYLIDMQQFFKRIIESKDSKIYTLIATRHWEKLWTNWDLSENGKRQAKHLWERLKHDLQEVKEKKEYNAPIYFFWHNTFFESILMTLHFWNNNIDLLNKKDKNLIDKRNIDKFPHNEISYQDYLNNSDWHDINNNLDQYIDKDRTKMLEYTESVKFIFYPHPTNEEPYMEIDFRWIKEKITYSKFNEIVELLKNNKW